MILKLKDILPNPFRDLKSNPLIEEKIVSLKDSIDLTGFWDNVVVRKNKDGKYECAYGHHRIAAAIRAGLTEADFIVKKLDDAAMIQIMDNENRDTYGSTPASTMESVRAVVNALASGTIEPFTIDPNTQQKNIFYAPSFVPGLDVDPKRIKVAYTAKAIAMFLGRTKTCGGYDKPNPEIVAAMNALYLKERGRFNDSLLVTKDKTGAKVPVTTSELLRITSDIKRDVETKDKRTIEAKQAAAAFDKQQRELQAQRKKTEQEAEVARQKLVSELAKAKANENKSKVEAIKAEIKAKETYAVEKAFDLEVRAAELEKKVEQRKLTEAAVKKEDEYLPIKREVERILHKLEGETSTSKEALASEVKALSRLLINVTDRERLRQAALNMGTFYTDWVAMQFLPPLSTKKKLDEYRKREDARHRAEDKNEENTKRKVLGKSKHIRT
jgi:hypothetical protein